MGSKGKAEPNLWFLLHCEKDDSHSIVDHNSVMNAKLVKENDVVTFFYGSRSYVGKIIMRNADIEVLSKALSAVGKKPKRLQKAKETLNRRCAKPPIRFTPAVVSTPKRKKPKPLKTVQKETKAAGAAAMVKQVLEEGGKILSGDSDEEMSANSDSNSDDELLSMIREKNDKKTFRKNLVAKIRNPPGQSAEVATSAINLEDISTNSETSQGSGSATKGSPSKEELKKLLFEANVKLGLKYDSDDDSNATKTQQEPQIVKCGTSDTSNELPPINLSDDFQQNLEFKDTLHADDSDDQKDAAFNHNDDSIGNPEIETNSQLFGKHFKDVEMVLLVNNIYCQKKCLQEALQHSSKPSHLARRLLSGVFTEEALVNCTLTGQKPRAAGRANYGEENVSGLYYPAVEAILDYTKQVAKNRHWQRYDPLYLKSRMTQRIGEITRRYKKRTAHQ